MHIQAGTIVRNWIVEKELLQVIICVLLVLNQECIVQGGCQGKDNVQGGITVPVV